jgi:hypothetical protein
VGGSGCHAKVVEGSNEGRQKAEEFLIDKATGKAQKATKRRAKK